MLIDLYEKFGNLNSLLGWGHARVIENLLAKRPDCPRALSDKFADDRVIKRSLMERGREIQLDQRTKAESDLAVAAASIMSEDNHPARPASLTLMAGPIDTRISPTKSNGWSVASFPQTGTSICRLSRRMAKAWRRATPQARC